jgi:hypothetical protein
MSEYFACLLMSKITAKMARRERGKSEKEKSIQIFTWQLDAKRMLALKSFW